MVIIKTEYLIFLNIKLQMLCKSHHLQCIKSSKRSREKGDISVREGQGTRPLFRWYCITNWHDCFIDITEWVQEYFQKPLLVNTIRCVICRCQLKLCHAKRKPYLNLVQKHCCILWANTQLKWTVSKCESVLWSDKSKFDMTRRTRHQIWNELILWIKV